MWGFLLKNLALILEFYSFFGQNSDFCFLKLLILIKFFSNSELTFIYFLKLEFLYSDFNFRMFFPPSEFIFFLYQNSLIQTKNYNIGSGIFESMHTLLSEPCLRIKIKIIAANKSGIFGETHICTINIKTTARFICKSELKDGRRKIWSSEGHTVKVRLIYRWVENNSLAAKIKY